MKAWILEDIGSISLQQKDVPLPGHNEVRVKVMACGICGSDIPRIYQNGAHNMPLVPGHEFAGVVEGIGKEVNNYWLGKRVAVCPKIPCGSCVNCKKGSPNGCISYDYSGSRRDGAYAEYVCVPAMQLIELPDRVSFEEGAMLEPLAVATNAVRRGCISNGYITPKDASIVVCGAGTIGLMVVMLLKEMGYRNVCVIGNKDIQKKQVASLGILPEYFCDKRVENPIDWLKHKSGGLDIYYECVGSNESINYALESLAFESKLVLVGNPRSDMTFSRDTYWNILRNQINLIGIWNSSFTQQELEEAAYGDDWHFALRLIEEGRIEPKMLISHKFTIDELDKGLILMRDKIEDYTKVMMINE